jgi:UDP-galactopyranose mutase
MPKKLLIIGGGFAGCAAAHLISMKGGWDVTVMERQSKLGGGVRTLYWGGHPYTIGPRHFLTPHEHLFAFLNKYVPMRRIPEHEFLTYVERDPGFYHFPIHVDDIDLMPDKAQVRREIAARPGVVEARNLEDYWVQSVGRTLYSKFINSYSRKMWDVESNTQIDQFSFSPKGVALKSGPKAAWTEAISAFPTAFNGYDDYFDIATQGVTVKTRTMAEDYDPEKLGIKVEGTWHYYDAWVNSISPEVIMKYAYGKLRWLGRDFMRIVLPIKEALPKNVYFLYYANSEPFTRIVEYKKFYNGYESDSTLLGLEIPSHSNELYPYPVTTEQNKAQRYFDNMPGNIHSVGRAGIYRYIDIDDIIAQAMEVAKRL